MYRKHTRTPSRSRRSPPRQCRSRTRSRTRRIRTRTPSPARRRTTAATSPSQNSPNATGATYPKDFHMMAWSELTNKALDESQIESHSDVEFAESLSSYNDMKSHHISMYDWCACRQQEIRIYNACDGPHCRERAAGTPADASAVS